MRLLSRNLRWAALAVATCLVAVSPAQARSPRGVGPARQSAEARLVLQDEKFIRVLMGRTNQIIVRDLRAIAQEDALVARQQYLSHLVPTNPRQARSISQQLFNIGRQIIRLNNILGPDKFRLSNLLTQTGQALNTLSQFHPQSPHVANQLQVFLANASTQYARQVSIGQLIIQRPLATPFVPRAF